MFCNSRRVERGYDGSGDKGESKWHAHHLRLTLWYNVHGWEYCMIKLSYHKMGFDLLAIVSCDSM